MNRAVFFLPTRPARDFLEVASAIAVTTVAAWFLPIDYRLWGDVYLVVIIALCLRVGRWAILFAAISSVLAWNFVIVPPRLSFSRLDFKDGVFLGTYFAAALLVGQLTARIRANEISERRREQRASALFHLSRTLSAARNSDAAITGALRQAETLFAVPTAVLLMNDAGCVQSHPASSLRLSPADLGAVEQMLRVSGAARSGLNTSASRDWIGVPLVSPGGVLGVFCLAKAKGETSLPADRRELIETFAAQIELLLERERFRAASEREKLLAESERLHRTLLDSVSHELKTPLAVLHSAAENLAEKDGPSRAILAGEVRTATDRLDRLVANLLNQSRLEAGRLVAQLDWCDARDIIGAARRSVGDSLRGRPLQIVVPDDMPLFLADFVLLEQCLVNLLSNAVLHTPPGTAIEVIADIDGDLEQVRLTVRDHGRGIAPEMREKLFQKFSRGPAAGPGGLGLGLSIVRGFMLAQGGEVVAEESPTGGAQFTLILPLAVHELVPHE